MLSKPIDEIERDDIQDLVLNAVPESRTLEYKRLLPGTTDGAKKEFLADVSSFANASGGDLIYGVGEDGGVATKATGLAGVDVDEVVLRLENLIRDGITPRLSGIRVRSIEGFSDGPVMLVRVPRSWASPHMVAFKNSSRFFTRNNAGKYQMDVGEIRTSFALSESVPERIRNFRLDRLSRVVSDETPVPLVDAPKIIFHVVPLSAFTAASGISPEVLNRHHIDCQPFYGGIDIGRFNVDGYINIGCTVRDSKGRGGYCQIFRNGIIEMVDAELVRVREQRKLIPSHSFEEYLIRSVGGFMRALKKCEISPPAFLMLTLVGYDGYEMAAPPRSLRWDSTPIDRDMLLVPEIQVDDYDSDVGQMMRPSFDIVWNASGWERSPNYDENGQWSPRR